MLQTAIVSLLITISQPCPPPVISLNGDSVVPLKCNEEYVELGASAWSECEGDLTSEIIVDNSSVNTGLPGTYSVTYDVEDDLGQAAEQVIRTVVIEDNFSLTVKGFNSVREVPGQPPVYLTNWSCNRPYDDHGATAWDDCDGDLTGEITVTGAEDVLPREVDDNFMVTYSVANSRGDTLTAYRYVTIVDVLEPVVSLLGPGQIPARILPPEDPDPAWWITAVSGYETQYPLGDPWRLYTLPDRWRIYDEDGLVEDYPYQYWNCDRPSYEEPGALAYDECEGPINPDTILMVMIIWDPNSSKWLYKWCGFMGDFDRNPPPRLANNRAYRIFYLCEDSRGNAPYYRSIRSRQIRTQYAVFIQTISGGSIQNVTLSCNNSGFNPKADIVALSTCEGDITSRVTVTANNVDFSKPLPIGSYRVRYEVSDNYGWSTYAQREVNVVDGVQPVITLLDKEGYDLVDANGLPIDDEVAIPWCMLRDKGLEWWREYPDEDLSAWYVLRPGEGWRVTDNCADDGMLTERVQMHGQQELRDALELLPAIREQSNTGSGENFPVDPKPYLKKYLLSHNVNDESGDSTSQAFPRYRYINVVETTPKVELKIPAHTTVECGDVLGEGEGEVLLRSLVDVSDVPDDPNVAGCDCDNSTDPEFLTVTGAIDTKTPGIYTVTYMATNALGKTLDAPVVLTVEVEDTLAPELTITPKPGVTIVPVLEWKSRIPFQWQDQVEVAAQDACSGPQIAGLASTGGMDFGNPMPGTYQVVFSAEDDAGNIGEATLTVLVEPTFPTITLIGESEVTVECPDLFDDPGVIATDPEDGDLGDKVVIGGYVDTHVPGSYTRTYTVQDSQGNVAGPIMRTVNVVDNTPPEITLKGADNIEIEVGTTFVDPGATAWDACNGDITDMIVPPDVTVDTSAVGVYTLSYRVTDTSGNFDMTKRTVRVWTNEIPVISLKGANPLDVECGSEFVDPGAKAIDKEDGDISASIEIGGTTVDTQVPGTYSVLYQVKDSQDNEADPVSRTVRVADTRAPEITLIGDDSVKIEYGTSYTEQGAMASDACDGDVTDAIKVGGDTVDTTVPRIYTVRYTVADSNDNESTVTRQVEVFRIAIIVPDVVGMTLEKAGEALIKAKLVLGTVTRHYSDTVPAEQVIRQNPMPGSGALSSSAVDVTVSKGPKVAVEEGETDLEGEEPSEGETGEQPPGCCGQNGEKASESLKRMLGDYLLFGVALLALFGISHGRR